MPEERRASAQVAVSDKQETKDKKIFSAIRPIAETVKDKTAGEHANNLSDKNINQVAERVAQHVHITPKKTQKKSRREMIVSLMEGGKEVSIKDIVMHFTDCGEKTIQRELAYLVQTNILKKTGDRRWSKYSLV